MKKVTFFALCLILGLILTTSAQAATFATSEEKSSKQANLLISQEIKNSLFSFGNNITVDGLIKGDAFIFASGILTFKQPVEGNVFALGQQLSTEDKIQGTIIAAGSDITIKKPVQGNVLVSANNVTIEADVEGDILVAAGTLVLAENIIIKGDLYAKAGKIIKPDSVTIQGKTKTVTQSAQTKPDITQLAWSAFLGLLTLLVLGAATWFVFPKTTQQVADNITSRWSASLLWGAIILTATPMAIILLLLTTVGWSLSIILTGVYILAIALTPIYAGLAISKNLFKLSIHPVASILIGLIIILLLKLIPVVGTIVVLAVLLLGLGAIGITFKKQYQILKTKL